MMVEWTVGPLGSHWVVMKVDWTAADLVVQWVVTSAASMVVKRERLKVAVKADR